MSAGGGRRGGTRHTPTAPRGTDSAVSLRTHVEDVLRDTEAITRAIEARLRQRPSCSGALSVARRGGCLDRQRHVVGDNLRGVCRLGDGERIRTQPSFGAGGSSILFERDESGDPTAAAHRTAAPETPVRMPCHADDCLLLPESDTSNEEAPSTFPVPQLHSPDVIAIVAEAVAYRRALEASQRREAELEAALLKSRKCLEQQLPVLQRLMTYETELHDLQGQVALATEQVQLERRQHTEQLASAERRLQQYGGMRNGTTAAGAADRGDMALNGAATTTSTQPDSRSAAVSRGEYLDAMRRLGKAESERRRAEIRVSELEARLAGELSRK